MTHNNNFNNTMETGDHFKNGAKQLKLKITRKCAIFLVAMFLIFVGFTHKAVGQWNIGHNPVQGGDYLSNVTAILNGNTLIINGSGNMADFWCTGANQYDAGGEAPWWFNIAYRNAIHTVVFQSGSNVTNISMRAFKDCIYLESITIPSSVTKINVQAFYGCSSLTSITIPNSVDTIEGAAFQNCSNLHTVIIENGGNPLNFIGYNLSNPCSGTTINTYNWFTGCALLMTLHLGRELNNWSSQNSNSLTYNLRTNNIQLTKLTIGNTITQIGNRAFDGCIIKTVEIEDKCTGKLRFVGMPVGNAGTSHFQNSRVETLYLGRDLEIASLPYGGWNCYSNESPFASNPYLKSVTIGCCVTSINNNSFNDCNNLDSLILCYDENLETIGSSAFSGCSSLISALNIPQGVIEIGSSAFQDCSNLPSLFIPKTVDRIGNRAFNNCTNLKAVEIEDKCTGKLRFVGMPVGNAGTSHFQNSRIETLYLGRDLETASLPYGSFTCFSNGSPFANNSYLKSVTIGCCVTKINDNSFQNCNNLDSLILCYDENLESIGSSAFNGCGSLVSALNIPQGVEAIGENAFRECSNLPSLFIPKTVNTIGNMAFNNCINLKTVEIEDKCTGKLRFVGNPVGSGSMSHFQNCKIETLYLGRDLETANLQYGSLNCYSNGSPFSNNSYLESVTIGDCVETINNNSFQNCTGITTITSLPCPPPTIGSNAFSGVPTNIFVHVKCECRTAYQTPPWGGFANFQTMDGSAPSQPSDINGSNTVCSSGSSQTYSIAPVSGATSYTWTLPDGWSGTSTATSITATSGINAQSGDITVKASNNCGSSLTRTKYVTVNSVPSQPGNINGSNVVCAGGGSQIYSISSVSGATSYTWTLPDGWSGTSTTTNITATPGINAQSDNITVKANNNCGSSLTRTKFVMVNSDSELAQPGNINGQDTVCVNGSSQTYSIAPVSGATSYTWTFPDGWSGTSIATSITATPGINAQSGDIMVKANNNCSSSLTRTKYVTVNTVPSQPSTILGATVVCVGNSEIYSVTPIPDATSYTWSLPYGWSGNSTTNSISVTPTSGGIIRVTANNSCGSSTPCTLTVMANTSPTAPTDISGTTVINLGQSTILTASGGNEGSGCTYQWGTGTCGNNIISGETDVSITVTPLTTTIYWVRKVGNCNEITSCAMKNVTVIPVGINESIANQLQIYPNPTTNDLFIKSDLQIEKVEIYSILGALLISENNFKEKISVSALPKGIYLLKVHTDKGLVVSKIVKE